VVSKILGFKRLKQVAPLYYIWYKAMSTQCVKIDLAYQLLMLKLLIFSYQVFLFSVQDIGLYRNTEEPT